jgi:putative ABC transport system permease protein
MTDALYLAWRYLAYHKVKTAILVTSITLIVFLPVGLRVLVRQSEEQLTARAAATPLLVGAKGSPLELALNSLYFEGDVPETMRYTQAIRVDTSGLALAVPLYVRFEAQGHPIVGTTLEYFDFRGLRVAAGSGLTMLGDCVLGARVAEALGVEAGDKVISSPESVFDLAGVYPLRMHVRGVLEFSDSPDDLAIFVDLKTAWVIEGLVHGHVDLSTQEATAQVLRRDSTNVVGNASVVQYQEITADNLGEFHFHGDQGEYPVTAVIAVPPDQRAGTILRGRYSSPDDPVQIIEPTAVIDELLDTVLTVQTFVIAAVVVVGISTLATAILVFMLSLRLRRREIETMRKIGGSRASIGWVMVSEVVVVLVAGVVLAGGLTVITSRFGSAAIRAVIF